MNSYNENAPVDGQVDEGNETTNHQIGEFLMTQSTRTIDPTGVTLTDLLIEARHTDRPIAELLAAVGVN